MATDHTKLYIPGDVLGTLKHCGGYYRRPTLDDPIVGYASTYLDGGLRKNFVGFEFFNCTKAQEYPRVTELWAEDIARVIRNHPDLSADTLFAAPMGGILFAQMVALKLGARIIYGVRKTTKTATDGSGRDESAILLDRHEFKKGEQVAIVDDVCNNFGTVGRLIALALSQGAVVVAILAIVNRSGNFSYAVRDPHHGYVIPAISLLTVPAIKFRQDEAEVARHVREGNIYWNPKNPEQWSKLIEIMKRRSEA